MKKLLLFIPLLFIGCTKIEDLKSDISYLESIIYDLELDISYLESRILDLESHNHDWDYADYSHTHWEYADDSHTHWDYEIY